MWWKRKRKGEWLPWYRARDYKGNLTEPEKRQLDAFRTQPKHPAAAEDDLPEEVREYIGRIELELYDKTQDTAVGAALALTAFGGALFFVNYQGCIGTPSMWSYTSAVLLMVLPWFWYRREWNKNAEAFVPSDHSHNPTDEGIRQQWELGYIGHTRQAARNAASKGAKDEW